MATPPPRFHLPPLRGTLPTLSQHRQAQQQRSASDEPLVPPLRWRRSSSHQETTSTSSKRRFRQVVADQRLDDPAPCVTRDDAAERKKTAYLLQREERQELLDEANALAAQLEQLRRRAGLPTSDEKTTLDEDEATNAAMEARLRHNHLFLGRLHSMVANELLLPAVNTMSTFIHLPEDMAQRRSILRGLRGVKLRRGIEVAMEQLHHLDHLAPYQSDEQFLSATGEYHWHRFAIHQFPNFRTARQLYDAHIKFMNDLEINMTAMLRQITLREDTDDSDPTVWNHRIITMAEDVGCTEELNIVAFAHFYPHSPATNSPLGVLVYDTVNIDDLYPYVPEERTCKDFQSVTIMYEVPKPGTTETVVVLKYCAFAVQLVPQFALPTGALQQLQANTSRWPNTIAKFLHEYVVFADDSAQC